MKSDMMLKAELLQLNHTAIPYKVEQGACKELPVLKKGSLQQEQHFCNESRFPL